MAVSLSSLTSSLSSLSFSSSHKPTTLFLPKPFSLSRSSKFPSLTVSASASLLAPPVQPEIGDIKEFVKSRLPGGFAAQILIATGRRKTAVARVVLKEGTGRFIINYRDSAEYFQGNPLWLEYIKAPLLALGYETSYDVFVKAEGGGLSGQAQAITLGIARALLKVNAEYRGPLKIRGLLTRDPRAVERKKVGLKKARKAPQYSKR